MLCNVALNGIEKEIRKNFPVNKTMKEGKPKVYVSRFADDIIITGKDIQTLNSVKQIIQNFLEKRGLELNESKTKIETIYVGFNFLGFNISRKKFNPKLNNHTEQTTVLVIKPSEKAVKSIKAKIKNIIRKHNSEIAAIIKELNPVLRGWGNYFKISYHSQSTFISIGHLVWQQMMKWVRRKHPRKPIFEASAKYIITGETQSNHKWV
jgi:RNA-directed DNA polymerase